MKLLKIFTWSLRFQGGIVKGFFLNIISISTPLFVYLIVFSLIFPSKKISEMESASYLIYISQSYLFWRFYNDLVINYSRGLSFWRQLLLNTRISLANFKFQHWLITLFFVGFVWILMVIFCAVVSETVQINVIGAVFFCTIASLIYLIASSLFMLRKSLFEVFGAINGVMFWLTPILYPPSLFSEFIQHWFLFNPLAPALFLCFGDYWGISRELYDISIFANVIWIALLFGTFFILKFLYPVKEKSLL